LAYLTEENVLETYKKSSAYMQGFLDPIDEQERIARNQPHPGIDPAYPKVTDGTTSSIIQKTPRRIIQQLPTGKVKSDTNDWLTIVAGYIYTTRIIPNSNEQNALIDKCWRVIKTAMAHGAAHSMTPIVMRGDYFGTDMAVPYIKNVKFEAGKLSDLDSNCEFVEAWYQTADIEAIIKKEKKLAKAAKERGEKYESTWVLPELEAIKDQNTTKSTEEESSANKDKTKKGGVKLVHAFQRGVGAMFYTFHPVTGAIVRKKKNKDPRGEMPLQTMYFETDGINPLGRGIVEQVGSLQNLMDAEMQMYQYNRALMLNPPLVKRGIWNKTQAKFTPNVIIDMGNDPNAQLNPLTIDTTAIQNFPSNYGLMKSQLLNLTASPDTSISAEVGNPGFGKTPTAINTQQANVSVDDNYIRKQFETWFERWSETAINLYFAERTGVEVLQLDKDTAMALRQLEADGKLEPGFVSEDDKIIIDYDEATEVLKFEVDASTSNMKNDAQQLETLDGVLQRIESSALLQSVIPPKKIVGIYNAIISASSVENPEKIAISDQEFAEQEQKKEEQMMAEKQMQAEAMQVPQPTEMQVPEQLPPSEELPPELPIDQPQPQQFSEDDLTFITALQDMGYSDEKIQQALAMDQMGIPNEEIIQVLEMTNGQ
jgi:hypothetical protein